MFFHRPQQSDAVPHPPPPVPPVLAPTSAQTRPAKIQARPIVNQVLTCNREFHFVIILWTRAIMLHYYKYIHLVCVPC